VVLVRPEQAANVGAAARAVRNGGLQGLDLVAPGDWRTLECWRTAWGAQEVLEEARVFPDLAAALGGAALAVAFSGRKGDGVPTRDVRAVAQEAATVGREQDVALVFGPEASGLTLSEMALCGARASIPSHPDQPSLNVAQAVMVAAYEVFRARHPPPPATGPLRATWDEKARLLALLREGLRAVGAMPPGAPDAHLEEWTALVQRLDLTRHELGMLEHMARRMARAGEGRR
jgi:tRNA/rRNA methyltransferase/tRNA (cytidine32/uridine32-2'-O)-methyltransferase